MAPRFAVLGALALGLASCAVESPPTRSDIQQQAGGPVAKLTPTDAWKAAPGTGAGIRDNWLASFGDAKLDALVAEALAANPDLRVASTKVEQAAQYVELAKSALRPQVNVLGSGGAKMGGGDALQAISLGVSWEPDLWGRLRYGRNAAQEGYASAQADFEFARQSIAATTARSWFTATEARQQMLIADEMVKAAQELVRLANDRRRIGPGNEQDVALARATLGNFQDGARQAKLASEQSLRALEAVLGRYPAAEIKARDGLPAAMPALPSGLPLEMLERRPDMIAAERRVAAAFNRVGEAKAAKLPRIVLSANIAAIQSDILVLKQSYENPSGGAGGRIVAPIYQGGALETQAEIRTLEQKEAVAQYARSALRALGDVENTLGADLTLAQREPVLRAVLKDNERALALAQTSYRVGRVDQRTVLQQQLTTQAARQALLRVQSEQLSQRVNLHLVLGGSFETPPAPAQTAAAADPPSK
jgi:multidrug efflux system outer membrane protein